jgi:hypothetical protein
MNSKLKRLNELCTPIAWAQEAQGRALKELGAHEGRVALAEAKRYSAWAEERALWKEEVARLQEIIRLQEEALQEARARLAHIGTLI